MNRNTSITISKSCAEKEIHADLVETLFGTIGSFFAGVLGGLIAPVIAWSTTGESIYLDLAIVIVLLGAYRITLLVRHDRTPPAIRRAKAKIWERNYTIGGVSYMTAVGVSVALLYYAYPNDVIGDFGIVIMLCGIGGIAGRNAGAPHAVMMQSIGLTAPFAVAALLMSQNDLRYLGLILVLVLLTISVNSTTKFLHEKLEAALRNGYDATFQRKRFGLALDTMSHGLCMGTANGEVTVVNHRVFDFFGIVAATTPIRLDALASAIARSSGLSPIETRAFVERWTQHAALPHASVFSQQIGRKIFDFRCERADTEGFVTVIEDVTEERLALREIERMAHYDELTGLPNRGHFQKRLERDLRHIIRNGKKLCLLSIDLDRFKEVNDSLGHAIGDQLLKLVAERLRQCAPDSDMVARFGGDEFTVLLQPSTTLARAEVAAQLILDTIRQPFLVDNHIIDIGVSIGVAAAPRDAMTTEGLIRCGDLALYNSKAAGRGVAAWFEPKMQETLLKKRRIEAEMRHALIAEEFVVFYQPIIDSRSERVVCLEALVRWRHPERGLISPIDFIPVAEETGLIVELGEWVLRRACLDALSWPPHVRVAVNLAPRQFHQSDLAGKIRSTLEATGLDADRLELEITETALLQDSEDISRKVEDLQALGVRLSLDDFGSGYSSLCYLDRFPVKKLKLDRAFTGKLPKSPKTQAIVEAAELLARKLDMDLVAEGVETHEQLACLASKNVFLIQGFFYSKPRPIEELAHRLECWSQPELVESAA